MRPAQIRDVLRDAEAVAAALLDDEVEDLHVLVALTRQDDEAVRPAFDRHALPWETLRNVGNDSEEVRHEAVRFPRPLKRRLMALLPRGCEHLIRELVTRPSPRLREFLETRGTSVQRDLIENNWLCAEEFWFPSGVPHPVAAERVRGRKAVFGNDGLATVYDLVPFLLDKTDENHLTLPFVTILVDQEGGRS